MKAKVEILDKRSCLFFHRWVVVQDNGYTVYYKCRKCNARKVTQPDRGYQPIDWDWLSFKK